MNSVVQNGLTANALTTNGLALLGRIDWNVVMRSPLAYALLLGGLALCLLIPSSSRGGRRLGIVLGVVAVVLFMFSAVRSGGLGAQATFWSLATLTIVSAAATISSRSAVYCAIWFAVSLLGTAGLFVMQDAQFLGVATIVVYAGAIVVTLLFVVMLAQPDGHETYDRISWGYAAKPVTILSVALLLGCLLATLGEIRTQLPTAVVAAVADGEKPSHMARLGSELFGRHLLAVELAGTLLLAALVGAIAMVIQGRDRSSGREELGS